MLFFFKNGLHQELFDLDILVFHFKVSQECRQFNATTAVEFSSLVAHIHLRPFSQKVIMNCYRFKSLP